MTAFDHAGQAAGKQADEGLRIVSVEALCPLCIKPLGQRQTDVFEGMCCHADCIEEMLVTQWFGTA